MTEAYSRFLLDLLEFCSRKYGGTLWSAAMDHFAAAEGIEIDDDETAERALATRVDKFHTENRIDPRVKPSPTRYAHVLERSKSVSGWTGCGAWRLNMPPATFSKASGRRARTS